MMTDTPPPFNEMPSPAGRMTGRIRSVETIPYKIPYRKPLQFASGSIDVADNVLVLIHTEDGVTGIAEAAPRPYTYGETQESISAVIAKLFAPQIVGLTVFDREEIRSRLKRTVNNHTAKGAIDIALWDAMGKILGRPTHQLLGSYTSALEVSHMLGFDDPAKVAAEAIELRESLGISSFKIKVGRRPIDDDIAVCYAVREAIGADAELYIDGNRGWTSSEAADALRRLSGANLSRAEELCPADDVLGRRWLVTQSHIPFVADESAPTPGDVTREILSGAATAISIKTARSGFSEALLIAHLTEGLGVEAVIGNQIDAQLGTVCSLVFGASQKSTSRYAAELSNYLDLSDSLLAEPLVISDGVMRVPAGNGLGVDLDEDKVRHYRVDGTN